MSNVEYWKSLNTMLRNDELEFSSSLPASEETLVLKLTYTSVEHFKNGIQYALDNPKVIAQLEYEFNNGQPIHITEKRMERARKMLQNKFKPEILGVSYIIAYSDVPIDLFLWECSMLAKEKRPEYNILMDNKRKNLITTLFGNDYTEETLASEKRQYKNKWCTQIIFESADFESAIDELIINLSDRTASAERVGSVYVHESLKKAIFKTLTKERVNALNGTGVVVAPQEDKRQNELLAKKYGGKLLCNDNNTICLLFDVLPKYLTQTIYESLHQIPVAINFFRTTKEVIQLLKTDCDPTLNCFTSIWTENIGVFYEVATEIRSCVIWSNSIGLLDEKCLLSGEIETNRFEN